MTEIILAEKKEDADWIFWNEITELLEASDVPPEKRAECSSAITQLFTGNEYGTIHYLEAGKNTAHPHYADYIRTRKRYRFADGIHLESYWQTLLYEKKVFRLKRAAQWLAVFCGEVVPMLDLILNYYSSAENTDYLDFIYKLKRGRIEKHRKHTNPLRAEQCLQELKKDLERLTESAAGSY